MYIFADTASVTHVYVLYFIISYLQNPMIHNLIVPSMSDCFIVTCENVQLVRPDVSIKVVFDID